MHRLLLLAAIAAVSGAAQAAAPNLHVGAMFEYVEPGRSTLLKRVRNSGDATAFVRVQITEVRYGSDGKPFEVEINTADAADGGTSLVASPSRLIVPAHGQQATRLLYQGDRERERYYRARFVPVLPQSLDEFALNETERASYRSELSAGVNVLTGYGVFVIVHPDQPRHDLRTEETADHFVLHNAGNTTVVLDDVRECTGTGKAEQCSAPRKLHLLPQRSQRFPRADGVHHRFDRMEGGARQAVHLRLQVPAGTALPPAASAHPAPLTVGETTQ